MIEILKKVYYCEHCNKKALTKHTIAKHEPICFGNEENRPACMNDCEHLLQPETGEFGRRTFLCDKFGKNLHTKGAEVYGLLDRYPDHYNGSELMPKHCLGYDSFKQDLSDPF